MTGFGFSFRGLKGERCLRTPPLILGSQSPDHGYSCFLNLLSLEKTVNSLLCGLSISLPSILRGTPQIPLLELCRRSDTEGFDAKCPLNVTGGCGIKAISERPPINFLGPWMCFRQTWTFGVINCTINKHYMSSPTLQPMHQCNHVEDSFTVSILNIFWFCYWWMFEIKRSYLEILCKLIHSSSLIKTLGSYAQKENPMHTFPVIYHWHVWDCHIQTIKMR